MQIQSAHWDFFNYFQRENFKNKKIKRVLGSLIQILKFITKKREYNFRVNARDLREDQRKRKNIWLNINMFRLHKSIIIMSYEVEMTS